MIHQRIFFRADPINDVRDDAHEPVAAVFNRPPATLFDHVRDYQQLCLKSGMVRIRVQFEDEMDWLDERGDPVIATEHYLVITPDRFWLEWHDPQGEEVYCTPSSNLEGLQGYLRQCVGEPFVPADAESEDFLLCMFLGGVSRYENEQSLRQSG